MTIETCVNGETSQRFEFIPSNTAPYSVLLQGDNVVGYDGNDLEVSATVSLGLGVVHCNSPLYQNAIKFTFTGQGDTPGLLVDHNGRCVDGSCKCYPLSFSPCNASDPNLLWTHNDQLAFQNVETGECIDVYANVV